MSSERDPGVISDTEGGEKPVREQLQKAHIAPPPRSEDTATGASAHAHGLHGEGEASELAWQRDNVDDMQDDVHDDATSAATRHHTRKRSRDSTAEEDELNNGQRKVSGERVRDGAAAIADVPEVDVRPNGAPTSAPIKPTDTDRPATPEVAGEKRAESAVEELASPKSKRSRLQGSDVLGEAAPEEVRKDATAEVRVKDESATKVPAGSAFANSSAVSPFGALGGSKSPSAEPAVKTSSTFASSAFGSVTGATSGFGAIGKASGGFGSGGSFATSSPKPDEPSASTSSSAFGGALGQKSGFGGATTTTSGFGSTASGFGRSGMSGSGGFGGGFGSGSGFGSLGTTGSLTTFASGKPSAPFKTSKASDAPADEEDDGEDGGDEADGTGVRSPLASTEDDKQDNRFYEQDLETGEEDESLQYSCRAKLYNFVTLPDGKKEWRERGLGVLRLNVKRAEEEEDEPTGALRARLLMRAEGSHRVVLNTPIKKEIKFGDSTGGSPQGGYMYFMGTIDGATKLELLQLKMRQQFALELHEKIAELQAEM